MKKIFKAKLYKSREKLEEAIKNEIGTNMTLNRKSGHLIQGSQDDLDKIALSSSSSIWGCGVEIK